MVTRASQKCFSFSSPRGCCSARTSVSFLAPHPRLCHIIKIVGSWRDCQKSLVKIGVWKTLRLSSDASHVRVPGHCTSPFPRGKSVLSVQAWSPTPFGTGTSRFLCARARHTRIVAIPHIQFHMFEELRFARTQSLTATTILTAEDTEDTGKRWRGRAAPRKGRKIP